PCLPLWGARPPRQRRPLNGLTAALATALEYRAEHAAQYLATEAGAKRTRRALGGRLEDGVGAPGATARPRAATQDPAEGAQHALAPRGPPCDLRLGGGPLLRPGEQHLVRGFAVDGLIVHAGHDRMLHQGGPLRIVD